MPAQPPLPYEILPISGSDAADEWHRLGFEAQLGAGGSPDPSAQVAKIREAERCYRQALRINPWSVVASNNLAIVFAQLQDINEALLTIERATMFDFDSKHDAVWMNRVLMLVSADRIDEALAVAREALTRIPTQKTRLAMGFLAPTAGEADLSIQVHNETIKESPESLASAAACFVRSLTFCGPAEIRAQQDIWYQHNRFKGEIKPHANSRRTDRPLRVGYVGGDFKQHSASFIFANVLLNHDREAVEPYFYSSLPVNVQGDWMTQKFVAAAGPNWRDIHPIQDDAQVAEMIRADKIDILVDLAGLTAGGRLGLFTRKPAPVQVCAWGFAHGTGVPEIDYFFADQVVVPEGERQHYAEKIFDLPCVITYRPPEEYNLKGISTLPYFKNDYITFGCYSRYEKLSSSCLNAMCKILHQVPESRLQFKDNAFKRPHAIKRVLEHMTGIDPKRLYFSLATAHPEHLQANQQADLILDPFPHSGGVVCVEQLYMGLPIVTLYGSHAGGRTTSSVLASMNRHDWIAMDQDKYVEKAVALANDIPQLKACRKTLRQDLLDSPVVKDYPKAVETAYRTIFERWANGKSS